MKPSILQTLTLGALFGAMTTQGFSASSAHYRLTGDSLPAGGGKAASTHHSSRGHIGPWVDESARTHTAQITPCPGYLGASYQVVRLACSALPEPVNEGERLQFSASAVLDDGTTLNLAGSDVLWAVLQGPVASIDAEGQAVAGHVYASTEAAVRASYQGLQGDTRVLVLDINSDNYGTYAKDGLPDDWQVRHFGENNPEANPGEDPDRDNQDNAYEHTAGTTPTDPASFFHLRIAREPGPKGLLKLIFGPVFPDREYGIEYRSSLGPAPFQPLEAWEEQDLGAERVVIDLGAGEAQRYYRVGIGFAALD